MDERVFSVKVGCQIPEWDARHRLQIEGGVGPECKDSATIHRINSIYLDVSEQPHMMRHWVAGGVLAAIFFSLICFVFAISLLEILSKSNWNNWHNFSVFFLFVSCSGFAYVAWKFGRDELFSLTRRPIRFNRMEKKIYAIRRRRFFSASTLGDITWEIPWSDETVFCIHRGPPNTEHDETYHIRCYQLDDKGNVLRGFAIGREWQGLDGMNDLLCQWNYWCWYMNHGPAGLPEPLLFLTEKEGLFESFLYCMYECGFGMQPTLRIMLLPIFAFDTALRVTALWTCRPPIWPPEVQKVSQIGADDPHHQPTSNTPVGWAETSQAHVKKTYPSDPRRPTPGWRGEPDGLKNARLWAAETAPGNG